ncbi:hypothetical protein [Lysobacter firmicutimachus]|uniref:Uncharacterized protein n=1 Tax=Lysobacter firmicutimachus TaxID=1792846 RepID=A0ABU8CYV6_9GAMM
MMAVLSVVDGLACGVIAWVCGALLLSAHGDRARAIAVNFGLLMLAVGTVALAFLPSAQSAEAVWALRAVKLGGAVVAADLYGQRLGWAAQARAVYGWLANCLIQARIFWRRVRTWSARPRSGGAT